MARRRKIGCADRIVPRRCKSIKNVFTKSQARSNAISRLKRFEYYHQVSLSSRSLPFPVLGLYLKVPLLPCYPLVALRVRYLTSTKTGHYEFDDELD